MPDALPATPGNFRSIVGSNAATPTAQPVVAPAARTGLRSEPISIDEGVTQDFDGDGIPLEDPNDIDQQQRVSEDEPPEEMQQQVDEPAEGGILAEMFGATETFAGVSGQDILAAIKSGEAIPNEIAALIPVTVKVNGNEIVTTAQEAAKGYQRLSDYTRGKQEIKAREQQVVNRDKSFQDMVEAWKKNPAEFKAGARRWGLYNSMLNATFGEFKDPAKMRAGLTRLGLGQALDAVAWQIAEEEGELIDLERKGGEEGKAIAARFRRERLEKQKLEAKAYWDNEALLDAQEERKRNQLRQQQQQQRGQQQQPENDPEAVKHLQNMKLNALRVVGLKDSPIVHRYYITAMQSLYDPNNGVGLEDAATQAAQIVKEQLEDERAAHRGPKKLGAPVRPATSRSVANKQNLSPLSGRPQGSPGAVSGGAASLLRKGGSTEDFKKLRQQGFK